MSATRNRVVWEEKFNFFMEDGGSGSEPAAFETRRKAKFGAESDREPHVKKMKRVEDPNCFLKTHRDLENPQEDARL